MITSDINKKINEIINKYKGQYIENEFDLNRNKKDINYEIYLNLIRYFYAISKKDNFKVINEQTIDVSYSIKNEANYRITIDSALFDSCYSNFKSNSNKNIYLKLLYRLKRKEQGLSIIKKTRNAIYDFDDYNIRFRSNNEEPVNINNLINEVKTNKTFISFRLKKRVSLFIKDTLRIDLTNAIRSNTFSFDNKPSTFELEIEMLKNDFDLVELYIKRLLKVIQQNNVITTLTDIKLVNSEYNKLFNKPNEITNTRIDAMNVISLGVNTFDNLENKYMVTDKADGEHSFLLVSNNTIYLISQYFHVKNTGVKVDKKYNGTIIDGEALFINNKYLFMGFDCLFYCGNDIRNVNSLVDRIEFIKSFCKEIFKTDTYNYLDADKVKSINVSLKHYQDQIIKFNKSIVKDINSDKKFIIYPKLFLKVYGLSNNEIFTYSKLLWDTYTDLSKQNQYPYHLDGMVYQPIDQIYTLRPKNQIYKWKPSYQNSIDFYFEYKKDDDGNILTVYDTISDNIDEVNNTKLVVNKKYRIGYLYVGHIANGIETPTLFKPKLNNPDNDIHIIYIPINDKGYCEDEEHNIINDKTVVECYYDESESKYFRWKVMRTRYDKTENVMNYKRKYGNNEDVANGIWNCIKYPITFKDITDLSSDKYVQTKDKLHNLSPSSKLTSESYYTVDYDIRNAVDNKVNFHNFVKTTLINAYCRIKNGKKMSVFDPAIGKGKDIYNYYNAHVRNVIGMDIDFNGLHGSNGTLNKYKALKTKPGVPPMDFINGDFTVELNSKSQINSGITDKSNDNIRLMNKYFKYHFDVISCHFAFHYFLATEDRFEQTLKNIELLLNHGGYIILTLFDGQLVNEYIEKEGKDGVVENYIDVNGIKTLVHKITKKYNTNDKDRIKIVENKKIFKCGNAIDVFVGEGGINETEYLVDKDYLIERMKDHNLELVETATFEELYNNYKSYITEVSNVETKPEMKQYLNKLKRYYEDTETNKECFKITRLNRIYAFKKI